VQDPTEAQAVYPLISGLPEDHYDGLIFTTVWPHYSELRYNADGTRTTKLQRKQLAQEESTDMAEASSSDDSDADAPPPMAKIVEVMEDIQPSKATTPASSHMEEDKGTAEASSSSALDTFHLNLPESSLMSRHAALRLDTSGRTPSMSVRNEASTPSSAVSSASSANLLLPTRQEETEQGRRH
jgi:hypothetical protein